MLFRSNKKRKMATSTNDVAPLGVGSFQKSMRATTMSALPPLRADIVHMPRACLLKCGDTIEDEVIDFSAPVLDCEPPPTRMVVS